jgi:hypothetical protein
MTVASEFQCWPLARPWGSGKGLTSLGDALEFPAEDPRQHEKNNQHENAKTREGIAHELLRDLAKRMASQKNGDRPKSSRHEIERQENGPG